MNFNERSELLFKKLMSMYLNDGKPVGSTALAKLPEVGVSSATVRNVMADLERMGLIHSPHTSAGRIPTDLGFRVFVDTILTVQPLNESVQQNIQQGFQLAQTQDELIGSASSILSSLTGMASLVMLPNKEQEVLRHIDFVRLGEKRLLVVLVLNDNDVQNRIIELEEAVSESELLEVANYLNKHFVGHSLRDVKQKLVGQMDEIRLDMNQLMRTIMDAADRVIDSRTTTATPYFVSGKTNLLNYQELADTDKLKALFQSFEQHSDMLNLLDKSMQAKGVQVFIGTECGHEIYQNCSIVTTPYDVDGEVVGVLGVVGPSRMHYDHIVPRVDMTAKILSSLLKSNR